MLLPASDVEHPLSCKKLLLVYRHGRILLRKHAHALVPELPDLVVPPRRQVSALLGYGRAEVVAAREEGCGGEVADGLWLQQVVVVSVPKPTVLSQTPGPNHAVARHRTRMVRPGRDARHLGQPLDVGCHVSAGLVPQSQRTGANRHRISTIPPREHIPVLRKGHPVQVPRCYVLDLDAVQPFDRDGLGTVLLADRRGAQLPVLVRSHRMHFAVAHENGELLPTRDAGDLARRLDGGWDIRVGGVFEPELPVFPPPRHVEGACRGGHAPAPHRRKLARRRGALLRQKT
mmetsp:Transcript_41824/g.104600  ORF Transcript_41824/g.104600 Transcript_41824/m.104600 type:complete len:288 (+) Transcript_41824:508-1371(+)